MGKLEGPSSVPFNGRQELTVQSSALDIETGRAGEVTQGKGASLRAWGPGVDPCDPRKGGARGWTPDPTHARGTHAPTLSYHTHAVIINAR